MSIKPLTAAIILLLVLVVAIYVIYLNTSGMNSTYRVASNEKWIGMIDMDANKNIDLREMTRGHDAMLTIDLAKFSHLALLHNKGQLELANFDQNQDGFLDILDPIYPYLHTITFLPNGQGYVEKDLHAAGIRGIKIGHDDFGNHQAVLSDGSTRTIYEIKKPGGASIYKNNKVNIITPLANSK